LLIAPADTSSVGATFAGYTTRADFSTSLTLDATVTTNAFMERR